MSSVWRAHRGTSGGQRGLITAAAAGLGGGRWRARRTHQMEHVVLVLLLKTCTGSLAEDSPPTSQRTPKALTIILFVCFL